VLRCGRQRLLDAPTLLARADDVIEYRCNLLHLLTAAYGTKRTSRCKLAYVRFWGKADMRCRLALMTCAAFDP